jgi:hypothetical protein
VKAEPVLAMNWAFRRRFDHGSGGKVGANGRAVVDNRQQWKRQSGNNQQKMMVASGGIDSHGGNSKQWRSTAIGSEMPAAKAIAVAPPTPLLLLAGGSGQAATAAARE